MKVAIYLKLLIILLIAILIRLQVINNILINNFITEPLLLTDLLGKGIILPWRLIFLLDLINIFLIFCIGKKLKDNAFGLLAALLYGILPWMVYGDLFGSSSIFFLFVLLALFYGVLLMKENRIGFSIMIISSIGLIYSMFFSWLILPILIAGMFQAKLINKSDLKVYAIIIVIFFLPILVLSFRNLTGLKNIYRQEVGLFSEPGLRNAINAFQGESEKAGFKPFAKLAENKYLYLLKYLSLKLSVNLVPSTYFTSQEKLFNFSFSPPIFVGLLAPFLLGVLFLLRMKEKAFYLYSLSLILPSILSKSLVDLNRLIIFSPILIYLISLGFMEMYKKRDKLIFKLVLVFSIFLVLFQFVVVLSDIQLREPFRYRMSIAAYTPVLQNES